MKGGLHVLGVRKAAEENVRARVVSTKVSNGSRAPPGYIPGYIMEESAADRGDPKGRGFVRWECQRWYLERGGSGLSVLDCHG